MTRAARNLQLSAVLLCAACSTDLGSLPALCPDGRCPEGYDCINGVCALPDTPVPVTVARLGNLRDGDLQLVAQGDSVFIVWETYPYSELGQAVVARRLGADGSLGNEIVLDNSWPADAGAVEPFFAVTSVEEGRLLLALSSSAVDDDLRPRLRVFAVDVSGDAAVSEPAWPAEVRMSTIGYGNVSQPRFVNKDGGGLELGYFAGVVTPSLTFGRLAVFDVDDSGALSSALESCDAGDPDCCSGHRCYDSTRTEGIAAGVEQAFPFAGKTAWVIDKTRPSCLVPTDVMPGMSDELFFDPLNLPLASGVSEGIVYLAPSPRTGDKLPDSPAAGSARLFRRAPSDTDATQLAELPVIRDAPRPAWALRDAMRGYLVSPGALVDAAELLVVAVDTEAGTAAEVLRIPRLSSLELGSIAALVVADRLFVTWLEIGPDGAVIRAAIVDAP